MTCLIYNYTSYNILNLVFFCLLSCSSSLTTVHSRAKWMGHWLKKTALLRTELNCSPAKVKTSHKSKLTTARKRLPTSASLVLFLATVVSIVTTRGLDKRFPVPETAAEMATDCLCAWRRVEIRVLFEVVTKWRPGNHLEAFSWQTSRLLVPPVPFNINNSSNRINSGVADPKVSTEATFARTFWTDTFSTSRRLARLRRRPIMKREVERGYGAQQLPITALQTRNLSSSRESRDFTGQLHLPVVFFLSSLLWRRPRSHWKGFGVE